jgi:hypothetical protein
VRATAVSTERSGAVESPTALGARQRATTGAPTAGVCRCGLNGCR